MASRVVDWIAHHADHTPDKLVSVDLFSARRFTYAQMHERVGRLAGFLHEMLGVERGDRVALLTFNTTDFLEIEFACARLGAVFVPLNFRLTVGEHEFIARDCTPKVLVCDTELESIGSEVARRCGIAHFLRLRADGGASDYESGIGAGRCIRKMVDQTHDDLWGIMYTSGTTGHPKGVMITHGMPLFSAVNLAVSHRITRDSVNLAFMPLFHIGALVAYANSMLLFGGTNVVARTFDPALVLKVIGDSAFGVTHIFGVPASLQILAQQPDFATTDFGRVVSMVVGGAPSPEPLLKSWLEKGVSVQNCYGMTETASGVLGLDKEDVTRKMGSVGKPFLHTQVRVVDPDGKDVGEGCTGELWVRGGNVTPGYWNRPDANRSAFTDGWLRTGDAVRVTDDGYYFIVDRWKDMYISGGENVYPAEVEKVLYGMPEIEDAAVIGVTDEKWGEVGRAYIVVKRGETLTAEQIALFCQDKLARYKQPKSFVFVDALPRTPTGKVKKNVLRDLAPSQ